MKNKYTFFVLFVLYSLLCTNTEAQDVHFSQFWMAPLAQNPAAAGATKDMQAVINYKDQWSSVASPYKTYDISFDMRVNKKNAKNGYLAVGAYIFNDKAGDGQIGTFQGNFALAYHVFLNKHNTLGAGIMGGFAQRSINFNSLEWANQYNGAAYNSSLPSKEPQVNNSITYPDASAGIIWTYNKKEGYISGNDRLSADAGIAVYHLNTPAYSFYHTSEKLDMKFVVHGNALVGIKNSNISLVPGFLYYIQGSSQQLEIGSMVRYTISEESKYTGFINSSAFSLGLHYRNNDALIASMLYEKGPIAVGLSYDVNISGLKTASNGRGGFEISLRYVSPKLFAYKSHARL